MKISLRIEAIALIVRLVLQGLGIPAENSGNGDFGLRVVLGLAGGPI